MSIDTLAQRRLLIVNPNSNPAVTAKIKITAQRVLGPYCQANVIEVPDSPFAIESRRDRENAEPSVIALLRQNLGYDAYVMACFDDIAVAQARSFLDAPIVDAVTASVAMARTCGARFSVVTTVKTMVPGIQALITIMGVGDACTVLAADVGVAEAALGDADALQRLDAAIMRACELYGAEAIVLGSGGLTGHATRLSQKHGLPVIDCIEAAVKAAEIQSQEIAVSENI